MHECLNRIKGFLPLRAAVSKHERRDPSYPEKCIPNVAGAIKDFWTTILAILHPSNCPISNIHLHKIVFMGTTIYDVCSRRAYPNQEPKSSYMRKGKEPSKSTNIADAVSESSKGQANLRRSPSRPFPSHHRNRTALISNPIMVR